MAVLDTDRNGKPEVYVGGYGEDGHQGRVWQLQTGPAGLTGTGATSFHLGTLGGPTGRAHFGNHLVG
ncbi:hypothetical protein ABGB16_05715 [Micromonospora sp. B11E3]|uniref:hypothetical protein n=1 Tax=Micromonospora sp. B11E3 TaxID=3153562 RepID=UPI00325CD36C